MHGRGDCTPLRNLSASLTATPPRLGLGQEERYPLLEQLDCWARRADVCYWDCYRNESNPDLFNYFMQQMENVLSEVASTKITSGAKVWKMYSSGSIVKTARGVFSVDVVQGPWKDITRYPGDPRSVKLGSCNDDPMFFPPRMNPGRAQRSLPKSKGGEFIWVWPERMLERYAELVDVHMTSHLHGDHTDYALVDHLMRKGKPVVVADDTKSIWVNCQTKDTPSALCTTLGLNCTHCTSGVEGAAITWAERVITLDPDTDTQVGPFEIRRLGGPTPDEQLRQGMWQAANGSWECRVDQPGEYSPLMNVHLVRLAGGSDFTYLHNGDNRCYSILPGLKKAMAAGWAPTVVHRIHSFVDNSSPGLSLDSVLPAMLPGVHMFPGHEYEFGHKGLGKTPVQCATSATPCVNTLANQYAEHRGDGLVANGSFFVMTWGESIEFA